MTAIGTISAFRAYSAFQKKQSPGETDPGEVNEILAINIIIAACAFVMVFLAIRIG